MSRIVLGLMRINDLTVDELEKLIEDSLNLGITKFDIADIYGSRRCEIKLGEVLKKRPDLRSRMYLQSKVGIAFDTCGYDSSYDYLVNATKGCIDRLNCSYLDSLLIHRPDIFMDNNEVAKAIDYLQDNHLIIDFGVSNFTTSEIEYLKETLNTPIKYNQVQLGICNTTMIDQTMYANMYYDKVSKQADDLYFYLKKENIIIQCWSPFQYHSDWTGIFNETKYPEINSVLDKYATKYKTTKCGIATAFLLRLNPTIEVISGSTKITHIKESVDAESINLTKEDWYRLYNETNHILP